MHSLVLGHTVFQFNEDFSGDVIITRNGRAAEIPGEFLLELAAEYVRSQKISRLEDKSWKEILLGD